MPRIPVDDKVWIESKRRYVGGQGANAAQDMAKLGLVVSFMTRVGDDDEGLMACRHFKDMGMDTAHCIVVPGAQTMSACVTIGTADQTRSCLMHRDPKLLAHDIRRRLDEVDLDCFDVVYTDGHQLDLALPVVARAVQRGMPVVADMEVLDADTRRLAELATELIAPAKVITALAEPDEHPDPGTAALALADRPGRTVVATAGPQGSYGAHHGDRMPTHVPAHPDCKATDTVGAGDAYHAGFLAAMARGHASLADRMHFATSVAAALCETPGPVVSLEALLRYGIRPLRS